MEPIAARNAYSKPIGTARMNKGIESMSSYNLPKNYDGADMTGAAVLFSILTLLITLLISVGCVNSSWEKECVDHHAAEWSVTEYGKPVWVWKDDLPVKVHLNPIKDKPAGLVPAITEKDKQ